MRVSTKKHNPIRWAKATKVSFLWLCLTQQHWRPLDSVALNPLGFSWALPTRQTLNLILTLHHFNPTSLPSQLQVTAVKVLLCSTTWVLSFIVLHSTHFVVLHSTHFVVLHSKKFHCVTQHTYHCVTQQNYYCVAHSTHFVVLHNILFFYHIANSIHYIWTISGSTA